jgi:hypothetical protein
MAATFLKESGMETCRRAFLVAALLVIAAPGARGQSAAPLNPGDAKPFLGVWVIEMTEPAVFKGTHTIRVWDNNGTVAASLQTNPNFPAIEATGIHRDGNMLVLTLSHNAQPHPMQENGMPIWAVVSAVVDGDTMRVAQMLERSQTIKRGAGNRQN